jgi:hypothetical protein
MARNPHRPQPKALAVEKNSPRGLVPTATFGKLDQTYNDFLTEVDPQNNVQAHYALAAASDKRFREFLRIMGEPRFRNYSLAALAKTCDISLPEWADFWRKAQIARSIAEASNAIPQLTRDLVADARTQDVLCERCDGLGTIDPTGGTEGQVRTCPGCKGLGTLKRPGDTHARDRILEMTGVTQKGKGGAAVTINANFGGLGIDSATERLNRISFDVSAEDLGSEPL